MQYSKTYPVVFLLAVFLVIHNSAICQSDFWVKPGAIGDSIVNAIAFDTSSNPHVATNNGIYRSTDHGTHWTQIGLADSVITSIAIQATGQIFAGLLTGTGLFRSTDAGGHWIAVMVDTMIPDNPIESLTIDASGHVFAGGNYILFRSTDNGLHWASYWLRNYIFNISMIQSVVQIPTGLVFAAHQSGVYRSSDDGTSWELKIKGLDDTTATALGFDQTGYVYAGIWGMGIYRSPDNGENWERSDNGVTNHYISSLASNILDRVFVGTNGGGVFKTTDNGDNWQAVISGLTNLDIKCLAMSPDGYLYAGTNGGGVFRSQQSTTGIERSSAPLPRQFNLGQNYPNPFNPSTDIRFTLSSERQVTLKVFDIRGREITTLLYEKRQAGEYLVHWNAAGLPSGIYFYCLQAGKYMETKKMLVIR